MKTFAAIAISVCLARTGVAIEPSAKERPIAEEQDLKLAALRAAITAAETEYRDARAAAAGDFEIWLEKSPEGPTEPSRDGEIARFTFDSVEQGQVRNEIPRGPSGRLNGTPAWQPGKDGNGLSLDGDFRITVSHFANFSRVDPFTFGFWIRVPKLEEGTFVLLHHQAESSGKGYRLAIEGGHLTIRLQNAPRENAFMAFASRAIVPGRWNHVAVTHDGSGRNIRFYLDGQSVPTMFGRTNLTRDIADDKVDLTIGSSPEDAGIRGRVIDDVRIFSRELSSLEIAALAGREDYREAVQMVPNPSPEQRKALFDYYAATSHPATLETWQKLHKAREAERVYLEK